MFRTNLIIAWRNLLKYRVLSLINISGLALGIATCLLIILYVADEYSYDRYNQHADRIYRVILKGKVSDELISEAVTPAPLAKTLQDEFPEVELGIRLKNSGTPKISYSNNTFRTSRLAFVDPEFFQIFTLPSVHGVSETALKEPNTVVITTETSRKYFGNQNPIGKVLDFDELDRQYRVTGVIEKVPENSHFHFDLFATTVGLDDKMDFEWIQSDGHCYLLLQKDYSATDLEVKFPELVDKYMGPEIQEALGMSMTEFKENGNYVGLYLQPLTDIHLRSDLTEQSELEPGGSVKTLYVLSAIALFILVIACINFVNLSTSISTKRAKEVGVKKVLGGHKQQLILQFLMESFLVVLVALLISVLLVFIMMPYFNSLSGKSLQFTSLISPQTLVLMVIFGLVTGLLAGIYPAFVLSSFKPISALKGKIFSRGSSQGIRSGLVILQFSISVILIIGTLIADLQMSYILNKDIGYDKDQILVIRDSWMLGEKAIVLKEQLESDSRVTSITRSGYIPAGNTNYSMFNIYPDRNSDNFRRTNLYIVDNQYLETMGMELISGSNFSKDQESDSSNTIINETAAHLFGLGDDAVGKVLTMSTDNSGGKKDLKVIGVVRDFHFNTLYQPIEPLFMLNVPNSGLIIRASTSDLSGLIATVQRLWNDFNTGEPFSYTVLDESYREAYAEETNLRSALRVFTALTIFVALIGLFGLVTFTIDQRVKEIGVRKVLGSSVTQIIILVTRDFLTLVCISFLVAFPAAFLLGRQWLQDFAYRIAIPWWVFLAAAILTILLAMATISLRSIKAALANPVDSLRTE